MSLPYEENGTDGKEMMRSGHDSRVVNLGECVVVTLAVIEKFGREIILPWWEKGLVWIAESSSPRKVSCSCFGEHLPQGRRAAKNRPLCKTFCSAPRQRNLFALAVDVTGATSLMMCNPFVPHALAILATSLLLLRVVTFFLDRSQFPPGPCPFPILGNLLQLNFQLHPEKLSQLARKHGSIFTVWLGSTLVVVLNGFQAVKDALVNHSGDFADRPVTPLFEDLFGDKGIISTSGHLWLQQRRFGLTTLRSLGMGKKDLEHRLQEEAQYLVEIFRKENGKSFDPHVPIVRAAANVICALVFGHRFSHGDPFFQKLMKAIDFGLAFVNTIWRRLYDVFPRLLRQLPGPHNKVFQYQEIVKNLICQEIQSHKQRMSEDSEDFISCYLTQITKSKNDPMSTFNEENLIQVIIDLFLGGTETTATTLRWALLYMIHHRDVQEKVQKELDTVLSPSQVISFEDRKSLPYTNAVLHEVQRFCSVISVGAVRKCVRTTTVQGFPIHKGTVILPNLASVLYDPDCWETPWQFNPGHFLDGDGNFVINEVFLPFSAGHRVCLGELLAKAELFLVFTNLLREFQLQVPEGTSGNERDYIFWGTLQPQPYRICVRPRLGCSRGSSGGEDSL
ncbi:cytochrome P450 2J2-like [Macrotis lagotis]|uniref:cytochrome P450 2J2-like n=1 Tax=Macrotis lagotis TaxID=92651 RepID=UPI003D68F49E